MAQRSKPKEQKKVIDATVIDEEILKYYLIYLEKQSETTSPKIKSSQSSPKILERSRCFPCPSSVND